MCVSVCVCVHASNDAVCTDLDNRDAVPKGKSSLYGLVCEIVTCNEKLDLAVDIVQNTSASRRQKVNNLSEYIMV